MVSGWRVECRHSCKLCVPNAHPRTQAWQAGHSRAVQRALAKRCWCGQSQSQRMGRAWRHHGMTLSAPGIAGCSRARGVAVAWDVHLV